MECARCKQPIPEGEECNYYGKILCEDCYIEAAEPPKTCDVAAVYSAKKHRALAGQTGTEGLTEQQKNIYEYVKKHGKATKQELLDALGLSPRDMDRQLPILRHCELLKAHKIGQEIYIVPFDFEAP
ncbi:MAG: hypothetical protein QHH06_11085 [Clostridiales bacterium]|jgi:recombinational DNA repair protein (RecF pathway)|nr:hypothetical protein [Eubacteriales bacterium]MDH7567007.1 hypothetical protein [Clostridiales bacterium]